MLEELAMKGAKPPRQQCTTYIDFMHCLLSTYTLLQNNKMAERPKKSVAVLDYSEFKKYLVRITHGIEFQVQPSLAIFFEYSVKPIYLCNVLLSPGMNVFGNMSVSSEQCLTHFLQYFLINNRDQRVHVRSV